MICEVDLEIYSEQDLDDYVDDDALDAAEAGFMHGYLGRWRGL